MLVFGGVNKEQQRFQDLYELNINEKHWIRVESQGDIPTSRTFHRGVVNEGYLYVLGGYDGNRRNDMYRVFIQSVSPEECIENDPLIETIEQLESEPFV